MKAVIIEDEQRASKRIKKLIESMDLSIEVLASLGSVKQSINWFGNNKAPDFIISDIQLGDGRAFEVFQNLPEIPPVIFTTAYDQYALKAFKSNGIDYILKPIDPDELRNAIKKIKKLVEKREGIDLSVLESILGDQKSKHKSRFMIKVGDKIKSIPAEEVSAFYAYDGGTYLRTFATRNYSIDYSMDLLEDAIDNKQFFRVNRALIINFDAIEAIHIWSGSRLKIELKDEIQELDSIILVSRERVKDFKLWLDR